MLADT